MAVKRRAAQASAEPAAQAEPGKTTAAAPVAPAAAAPARGPTFATKSTSHFRHGALLRVGEADIRGIAEQQRGERR